MQLAGKKALITGGGRGIGRGYVERFLTEGADVVIGDLDKASATATVAELSEQGNVSFVKLDVADPEAVKQGVAEAAERLGGIDVLVNNAALLADWDRENHSLDNLKRVFDVNLHSLWLMTREVAPWLIESGRGRIVNQSSTAAYNYAYAPTEEFGGLDSFSYAQSKYGVIGLTKLCAGQLGQYGVTVNCIAPGVVRTQALTGLSDALLAKIVATQAVKGAIQPQDLTGVVAFFASDEAKFVTGQVLVVDGGRFMPA